MSADFWAGYISGAAGILIGNPLDLIKTRIQAGEPVSSLSTSPTSSPITSTSPQPPPQSFRAHFDRASTLARGAPAPILGYGALNALLFVTYNRTLSLLSPPSSSHSTISPPTPTLLTTWLAGATGGLATFLVSAPTELIKCRAQVARENASSWTVAREVWRLEGLRGLYHGGGVTSVRDAVGYGFYFWSYEWSRRAWSAPDDTDAQAAVKVLVCGGLAGVVTWASIFPLDVVKTRVQTQHLDRALEAVGERRTLLRGDAAEGVAGQRKLGAFEVAKHAYRTEGTAVFFRGLGICSLRAFVVNAVQWAVYEWMMRLLQPI